MCACEYRHLLTAHPVRLDEQISVKSCILFMLPNRVVVRQTDVCVGGATVTIRLVRNVAAGRDILTAVSEVISLLSSMQLFNHYSSCNHRKQESTRQAQT